MKLLVEVKSLPSLGDEEVVRVEANGLVVLFHILETLEAAPRTGWSFFSISCAFLIDESERLL